MGPRIPISLLLVVLAALLGPWTAHAAPTEVRVAALRDWPPQYRLDEDGEPTGFAIDVMDAVAEQAGLVPRYRLYGSFPAAMRALEAGEVDVIPNIGRIPSREARFTFTAPVETFRVVVFVRRSASHLDQLADLHEKPVGVVRGNVAVELLADRPGIPSQMYPDVRTALYDLLAGHIDGLAYPEPVVRKLAQDIGLENRIRVVPPDLTEVKRAMAVRDGDAKLAARLNRAVKEVVHSPRYEAIYDRWYGEDEPLWPAILVAAGVVALLALIAFLVWRRRILAQLSRALLGRRRAEAAQSHTEVRYRQLMDQAADAIFVTNMDGRYVDVNRSACEMLGYTREELLELGVRNLIAPEDVDAQPLRFTELEAGKTLVVERTLLGKGETRVPTEIGVRRVNDTYLGIARDISERKRAEQELHRREELLREAKKMEAVGRLAGSVAHEFNNLLTAILGNAELLLGESGIPSAQRDDVEDIRNAALRGRALTQQLLAFGRRQMRQPERLDVDDVVRGMERIIKRACGDGHTLGIQLGAPPPVHADRGQLEQVLLNLALNARDASPDGGHILIRTGRGQAADEGPPQSDRTGARVLLEVRDWGSGMDQETRDRVLEPFFTTKEGAGGTGLGLSIVHGIVEQSGGTLEIDSKPGEGTTIRVLLPQAPQQGRDAESAPPTEPAPASEAAAAGTVLVVEDEPAVRRLTARSLRRKGWTVLEAESAEQALTLVHDGHLASLDAVISDVVMPGKSGPELARELARHRPDLPVLFISGYADRFLEDQDLEGAHRAFLPKPFTPDALLRLLSQIVSADEERARERATPPTDTASR